MRANRADETEFLLLETRFLSYLSNEKCFCAIFYLDSAMRLNAYDSIGLGTMRERERRNILTRSLKIVFSTRQPSGKVRKRLTP